MNHHAALASALAAPLVLSGCWAAPLVVSTAPELVSEPAVTVRERPDRAVPSSEAPPLGHASPRAGEGVAPGRLRIRVFQDGCGVIRTEAPDERLLQNLSWSVTDEHGFQVLQRNALGETHYRYFQPGTYRIVLQAFVGDRYAPVSNEVTVHC